MPAVNRTEIRARRQRMGLKLGEFAAMANVSYKTLANVESGHQQPGIEVVHRIATALGVEAEDLLAEPAGRVA